MGGVWQFGTVHAKYMYIHKCQNSSKLSFSSSEIEEKNVFVMCFGMKFIFMIYLFLHITIYSLINLYHFISSTGMAKVGVVCSMINTNLRLKSLQHCLTVSEAKAIIIGKCRKFGHFLTYIGFYSFLFILVQF